MPVVLVLFNYLNNTIRYILLSHCTDEEIEAPEDIIYSSLHNTSEFVELGIKSRSIWSKSFGLKFLAYSLIMCFVFVVIAFMVKIVYWKQADSAWFLQHPEIHVLMKQLLIMSPLTIPSKALFVGGRMTGSFH